MQGSLFPRVTLRALPLTSDVADRQEHSHLPPITFNDQDNQRQLFILLVSWDYCGYDKFDGLKQQKFIFLPSWSPKFKIKVLAEPCSPWRLCQLGWLQAFLACGSNTPISAFSLIASSFVKNKYNHLQTQVCKVTEPARITITITLVSFSRFCFRCINRFPPSQKNGYKIQHCLGPFYCLLFCLKTPCFSLIQHVIALKHVKAYPIIQGKFLKIFNLMTSFAIESNIQCGDCGGGRRVEVGIGG